MAHALALTLPALPHLACLGFHGALDRLRLCVPRGCALMFLKPRRCDAGCCMEMEAVRILAEAIPRLSCLSSLDLSGMASTLTRGERTGCHSV